MTLVPFALAALGLLLVFLEFYLPGGIMGTVGAIMLISSIVSVASHAHSPIEVLLFIAGLTALLAFVIWFALKRIKNSSSGHSIYLNSDQKGFYASSFDETTVGKEGEALTDLKPAGYVLVEARQLQAISQSGYIDKGRAIIVLRGQGGYLVVKEKK